MSIVIFCTNGIKEHYLHRELHREDGPAVEYSDGTKEWWINGKRHRENGPAIEWPNGDKEWWVNGEFVKTNILEIKNFKWSIQGF